MNRATMKKYTVLIAIALLLLGCNKNIDIEEQEEDCMLILEMGGEIAITEAPLTKSTSQDLYLMQIYRVVSAYPSSGLVNSPYASGVFDNVDDMIVYLKKGYTYNIVVSLLKDGKTVLGGKYSAINNSICVETIATMTGTGQVVKKERGAVNFSTFAWSQLYAENIFWLAVNKIYYNDYKINGVLKNVSGIFYYADAESTELLERDLQRSFTSGNKTYTNSIQPEFVNIGFADVFNNIYCKCDDWLYGKASVIADGTIVNKTVELKRIGFMLQCDPVSGITDGSVTVTISKNYALPTSSTTTTHNFITKTFTDESVDPVGPFFYAFPNADDVWNNAEGYEEDFRLKVSWTRGIGVTEDFGSITIKMKRNMLNRVKVTVGTDDKNAGVNLVVESEASIESEGINKEL